MKKIFTFAIALVCALAVNAEVGFTIKMAAASDGTGVPVVTANTKSAVYLYVTGVSAYAGMQCDFVLPEGCTITGAKQECTQKWSEDEETWVATHSFQCAWITEASAYRLLISNTDNTLFQKNNGALVKLFITTPAGFTGCTTKFTNVVFAYPNGTKDELKEGDEFTLAETTGIEEVNAELNSNAPIYNLQGVRVNKAENGIFIQNGKKFVVK